MTVLVNHSQADTPLSKTRDLREKAFNGGKRKRKAETAFGWQTRNPLFIDGILGDYRLQNVF